MKFYISSRTALRNYIKEIINKLEQLGHEISYDWTKINNISRPYSEFPEQTENYAEKIIRAIEDSDVFIFIPDAEGTDMYGELCSAISFNITNKKPKIYVIGKHLSNSIFLFHPLVNHKKNIEEVLKGADSRT